MPPSAEQRFSLNKSDAKGNFKQEKPKTLGSKAYQRYDKYKTHNSIGEAMQQGANWQNISLDFDKGWLMTHEFPSFMDMKIHPERTVP